MPKALIVCSLITYCCKVDKNTVVKNNPSHPTVKAATTRGSLVLFRGLAPSCPRRRLHYSGFTHQETEERGLWSCLGFPRQLLSELGLDPCCVVLISSPSRCYESLSQVPLRPDQIQQVTFLFRPRTLGPAPVPVCPYVEMAWLRAQHLGIRCLCPHLIPTRHLCSGRLGECVSEPNLWAVGLGQTLLLLPAGKVLGILPGRWVSFHTL